ncbi:MAG: hypothetical protein IPO15_13040 [Anaerolineae bacterium]|uniref:hypothetical protein n=1 Tax=Candidatus Amarolinea dominans TaxID=3140696 RepID=UPI0031371489|nr:hypothetical protein [Anaerolineae bacterium]
MRVRLATRPPRPNVSAAQAARRQRHGSRSGQADRQGQQRHGQAVGTVDVWLPLAAGGHEAAIGLEDDAQVEVQERPGDRAQQAESRHPCADEHLHPRCLVGVQVAPAAGRARRRFRRRQVSGDEVDRHDQRQFGPKRQAVGHVGRVHERRGQPDDQPGEQGPAGQRPAPTPAPCDHIHGQQRADQGQRQVFGVKAEAANRQLVAVGARGQDDDPQPGRRPGQQDDDQPQAGQRGGQHPHGAKPRQQQSHRQARQRQQRVDERRVHDGGGLLDLVQHGVQGAVGP